MPPAALFWEPLDPANLRLACELSALALRLAPRRFSRGRHRNRSITEASDRRDASERSRYGKVKFFAALGFAPRVLPGDNIWILPVDQFLASLDPERRLALNTD